MNSLAVMHQQTVHGGSKKKRKKADQKRLSGEGKEREIQSGTDHVEKRLRFSGDSKNGMSDLLSLHSREMKWKDVPEKHKTEKVIGCHVRLCADTGYESEELVEILDDRVHNIECKSLDENFASQQGTKTTKDNHKKQKREEVNAKHDETKRGGSASTIIGHPQAQSDKKMINSTDLASAHTRKWRLANQKKVRHLSKEQLIVATKKTPVIVSQESKKSQGLSGSNPSRMSKLMMKFHGRFMSGHFRYLNEKLYTATGDKNFSLMQKDRSLFDEYHR